LSITKILRFFTRRDLYGAVETANKVFAASTAVLIR
jgi:hypothetical protein